jgi:hypothetical protein
MVEKEKIPKIIHYGWFGGKEMPAMDKHCLESWKKYFPDFVIKHWNESNFPFDIPYMKRFSTEKKWGLLIDYVKFKVLFDHGGIYMDTDMLVLKKMDELLQYDSFWGFESDAHVNTAIIGTIPFNPIIGDSLKFYLDFKYDDPFRESPKIISPVLKALGMTNDNGQLQLLGNTAVFPMHAFYPMTFQQADGNYRKFISPGSYAIHLWNATWFDPFRFFWNNRYKAGFKAVFKKMFRNPLQPFSFYKSVMYHSIRFVRIKILHDRKVK